MHRVPRDPSPSVAPWPVVATIASLRRYPLKSAAGEHLSRAELDADGLVGDRTHVVRDAEGRVLRPRDCPRLADLSPGALLMDPGELARRLGVPGAHVAPVQVEPGEAGRGAGSHASRAGVHLVGEDAPADPLAPPGADPGRRANVVLAAGPHAPLVPGAERGWTRRLLRVGDAELLITRLPGRCLGVYAEVVTPGALAIGDLVRLGGPSQP